MRAQEQNQGNIRSWAQLRVVKAPQKNRANICLCLIKVPENQVSRKQRLSFAIVREESWKFYKIFALLYR